MNVFEKAVEGWKAHDGWEFADREAAWKWFFEHGQKQGCVAPNIFSPDEAIRRNRKLAAAIDILIDGCRESHSGREALKLWDSVRGKGK